MATKKSTTSQAVTLQAKDTLVSPPSNVLRLVPKRPLPAAACADTVELLEDLLAKARAGHCNGIALAAMSPNGTYYVDVSGEFVRLPTFCRGALAALDDDLRDRVHGEAC